MELFMFCLVMCIGLVNYLAKDAGSFIGGNSIFAGWATPNLSLELPYGALLGLELLVGIWLADFISGMIHLNLDYQTVSNRELRLHAETTIPAVEHFKATDPRFLNADKEDQYLWNFHVHHDAPYPASDSDWELFMQIAKPVAGPWFATAAGLYYGVVPGTLGRLILWMGFFGLFTQATHFAAHARSRNLIKNKLVMFMQDYHIILNPAVHKIHHEQFDCEFCILNGWANPAVNAIRKFGSRVGFYPAVAPTTTTRNERKAMSQAAAMVS